MQASVGFTRVGKDSQLLQKGGQQVPEGKSSSFLLKQNCLDMLEVSFRGLKRFWGVRSGCALKNFERDIVDTLCHASRRSDTIGPNKAGFLP